MARATGRRRRTPPPRRGSSGRSTALRLYLSAQTPQSGTSGIPTTKIRAENSPTNGSPVGARRRPSSRRYGARNAKTWLTPSPSIIEVSQKTATIRCQSERPSRSRTLERVVTARCAGGLGEHARRSLAGSETSGSGPPVVDSAEGGARMLGRYVTRLVDAQARLGEAARRLQPPLAVGPLPADPAGQGLPQRDVARPSRPRGRHRRPDRRAHGGDRRSTCRPAASPPTSRCSSAILSMVASAVDRRSPTTPTPTGPRATGPRSTRLIMVVALVLYAISLRHPARQAGRPDSCRSSSP